MPKAKKVEAEAAADMTPMIDMVFQLLVFFVILINFSDADNNQRVVLPKSDLAIPPEMPLQDQVTLQIAPKATDPSVSVILVGPSEVRSAKDLAPHLKAEIAELRLKKGGQNKTVKDITVIIRAHQNTKTGLVQEIIQECQKNGYEKFALRALYVDGAGK